jgi:hypothetical protein
VHGRINSLTGQLLWHDALVLHQAYEPYPSSAALGTRCRQGVTMCLRAMTSTLMMTTRTTSGQGRQALAAGAAAGAACLEAPWAWAQAAPWHLAQATA